MEIIGVPKCGIQARYISRGPIIDISSFKAMGVANEIEETFHTTEKKKDPKNERICFFNGRYQKNNGKYAIERIEIGNIGLNVIIHGNTDIAKDVLNETISIISNIYPEYNLLKLKRLEEVFCIFRVKMNINPHDLINPTVDDFMRKIAEYFRMTDFSATEPHYPAFQVHFVSEPDIKRILSQADSDDLTTDIRSATGDKRFILRYSNPEDYKNRIFEATIETDLEQAKKLLAELEKRIASK